MRDSSLIAAAVELHMLPSGAVKPLGPAKRRRRAVSASATITPSSLINPPQTTALQPNGDRQPPKLQPLDRDSMNVECADWTHMRHR